MFKKLQSIITINKSNEGKTPLPLKICMARSQQDLEGAFKLLFECRTEKEWTQYDFRNMRVSPYHLLPTTTMIIAKTPVVENGQAVEKIVGSITLIKEGPFGLPGIKEDIRPYGRCGQFVELIVEPQWVASSLFIKEQLQSYCAGYALNYMQLETLLVSEKTISIYRTPDLQVLKNRLASQVEAVWPERHYHKTLDPVMDASTIEYFFGTRSSIFQAFSLKQKIRALLLFRGGPYFEQVKRILDIEDAPEFSIQRASARFESLLKGKVVGAHGKSFDVVISKVSRKGLAIVLPSVVDQEFFRSITEVQAQLKEDLWCCLQVKPVSFQNFRSSERGFEIIDADKVWFSFIYYLTVDYFPEEGKRAA